MGGWRAYRRTADAKINVVIALQDEPQHVFGKHRTDSVWPPLPPPVFFPSLTFFLHAILHTLLIRGAFFQPSIIKVSFLQEAQEIYVTFCVDNF